MFVTGATAANPMVIEDVEPDIFPTIHTDDVGPVGTSAINPIVIDDEDSVDKTTPRTTIRPNTPYPFAAPSKSRFVLSTPSSTPRGVSQPDPLHTAIRFSASARSTMRTAQPRDAHVAEPTVITVPTRDAASVLNTVPPHAACTIGYKPPAWPRQLPYWKHNKNPYNVQFADLILGKCRCSRICSASTCDNTRSAVFCGRSSSNCNVGLGCGNRLEGSKALRIMHCSKGYNVMATEAIPAGTTLGEYSGIITPLPKLTFNQVEFGYVLQFKSTSTAKELVYVDAGPGGSMCRFVNHSCSPNCKFEERVCRRARKMALMTTRDLLAGEEVTVKYSNHLLFRCRAGERNCVSRLLPARGTKRKAHSS